MNGNKLHYINNIQSFFSFHYNHCTIEKLKVVYNYKILLEFLHFRYITLREFLSYLYYNCNHKSKSLSVFAIYTPIMMISNCNKTAPLSFTKFPFSETFQPYVNILSKINIVVKGFLKFFSIDFPTYKKIVHKCTKSNESVSYSSATKQS